MGSHSLLQGIFPIQGSNPGLPQCRQIRYRLSHQGSPGILEWLAYPFSSGSSQPRSCTQVSCIAGAFFYQLSYQGSHNWIQIYINNSFLTIKSYFLLCFLYCRNPYNPYPWHRSGSIVFYDLFPCYYN